MFFLNRIKTRQTLAFSILLLLNFIFAFKYISRINDHALLISICYISFLIFIFVLSKKVDFRFLKNNVFFYSFVALYTIAHIVLFHYIKIETLNVDRWSVISSFWEQAFNGQYPYNAQSHMGNYPAPLPFYFILALPFDLISEIGYLAILGIIIFAVFLRNNLSPAGSFGSLFILLLSVSVFWEISVRSTILINTILFMLYLFGLEKVDFEIKKQYWTSAIIGGLLLSTRTIFALPMVIYVVFLFKSKEVSLQSLIGWSLIALGTLILTFLPLFIFFLPEFIVRNPFNVQTDHLFPFNISLVFIVLSIIFGFICSKKREILYYTSGIFVLVLITYFFLFIHRYGFMYAYLKSNIDISYMLFAFPFLLFISFSDENITTNPDSSIL